MKSGAAFSVNSDESPEGANGKAKPLVSVILATHNRAHRLPRALDSIYAQEELGELFDIEVIVVDDASTDATSQVVRRYRALKFIRLSERRGVSAALNHGLRASQGSYITFLDDDDEWLPHKLRIQVPLLEATPGVGVVYGQSVMRSGEEPQLSPELNRAQSGRVFLSMLMDNFCGHRASLLVRRSAFDSAGCFDESLLSYEDWDMSLRLAFHLEFLFVPGAVDIYNLSPNGLWLSRAASGAGADDAARVLEKALRMLPESARHAETKRRARAWLALDTSPRIADPAQAWAKVLATLREYPEVMDDAWSQARVTSVLNRLILQPEQSVSGVRDICRQFKSATRHSGETGRRWVQQAIAPILLEIACDPRTSDHDRLCAAASAVANAPSCPTSKRLLLRAAVRLFLGRRAYAVCKSWYRREKQTQPLQTEPSRPE